MKRRGTGSLFKRGKVWWVKYYKSGQPMRESSGSPLEKVAKQLLHKRLGAVATGQPIAPRADKVTVDELLDDLVTEYTVNGRKSLDRAQQNAAHLRAVFGAARAQALTTAHVNDYSARRQREGAANATINRELAILQRAYSLGMKARKILIKPYVPMLKEDNVRQGFFERDQFEAVQRHLPDDLKPVVHVAFLTGWRVQSELLPLTWDRVDFKAGWLRLEPGTTKNKDGRQFPFTPELGAVLEAQRARTEAVQRETGRIIPHVFHRRGVPIKDFRRAWRSACEAAGLPNRIPHDFRRTAVRNLERAGVSRSVAMKMVGHKTEAIYRRYAIVAESDLKHAAEQLHQASTQAVEPRMGTIAGTIGLGRPKSAP